MFETDNEIISFALDSWGNYIETYSVSMSALDAQNRVYAAKEHFEANLLSPQQKKLVERIRSLAKKHREM